MKKIIVVQPIHPKGMAILQEVGEIVIPDNTSDAAVIEAGQDAEALVVRLTPVSESLIDALPSLKVIGRNGVGVDNIDMAAASKRRIAVINAPGANSNSVAEYVVSAFVMLHKKFAQLDKNLRNGNWQFRDQCRGIDLRGKTIGIIGMGQIGSMLVQMCHAGFGMRVLIYDPYIAPERITSYGAQPCQDLDQLLRESDVVSLHVPLTPVTKGLIDKRRLGFIKPGAVLVNASRGGIVDEEALADALESGRLGGAALDVFGEEPPQNNSPLWKAPNLLVTPHIAGLTEDAAAKTSEVMANDVAAVLNGLKPVNHYNKDAFGEVS